MRTRQGLVATLALATLLVLTWWQPARSAQGDINTHKYYNKESVLLHSKERRSHGTYTTEGGTAQNPRPGRLLHNLEATPSITRAKTADELVDAFASSARDIEITGHLDLRGLQPPPKEVNEEDSEAELARRSLFTTRPGALRSVRGNCSQPDPVSALGLEGPDAAGLLPLKPYQCLIIVSEPWLAVAGGSVWVDNVYLKISRQKVLQRWAFITAVPKQWEAAGASTSVFGTNITFHAELGRGTHSRSAMAVYVQPARISWPAQVYLDGCIFTEWSGMRSPLTVLRQSVARVRNSVFLNMHLAVEIADVSYGSTVRFENVSFSGVNLDRGAVVGTTDNDAIDNESYMDATNCGLFYAEEDDEAYDVAVEAVPPGEGGIFGDEFRIRDATMSDCLFLEAADGDVLPGCPQESAASRANMRRLPADNGIDCNWDFSDTFEDYKGDATGSATSDKLAWLLSTDVPWLSATLQELPGRPASPDGWPRFGAQFGREPGNLTESTACAVRTSLAPEACDIPPAVAARIVQPLCHSPLCPPPPPPPLPSAATPAATSNGTDAAAVASIAIAAVMALCLLGVVWRCRICCRGRNEGIYPGKYAVGPADAEGGVAGSHHGRPPTVPSSKPGGGARGGLFSHTTMKIGDADVVGASGGAFAAWARRMQSHRLPGIGRGLDSAERSLRGVGALTRTGAACQPAPLWQSTHPWWLTGEVDVLKGQPGTNLPHAGGSAPSTQHASAGLDWFPLAGDGGLLRLKAESVAAGRLSADTEIFCSDGTFAEPAPSLQLQAEGSAGQVWSVESNMHAPHSRHARQATEDSCKDDVAEGYTQRFPDAQHAQQSQHAQHAQQAQHAQPAQRVRHTQQMERTGISFSISSPAEETLDETVQLTRAASRAASAASGHPVQQEAHGTSAGRAAQAGGLTTLAPSSDIGLSATDASFTDRNIRVLLQQLDAFGPDDLFLERFEMLGREQRRRGGQAVVQFARAAADGFEVAVKFFLDAEAFIVEAAIYAACFPHIRRTLSPDARRLAAAAAGSSGGEGAAQLSAAVARFLPQVEAICDSGVDSRGRPLPPCIIMEKGESLHDWSDRAEPDFFTVLSVLSNISQRLTDMHDAGFVHRDLKPANVMWLPRENRWTVMDFGCVARAGEVAPLSFTLAYAAPEVVVAFSNSEATIMSSPALDAWSLGVMAYELLTGAPAFRLITDGRCKVFAQMTGKLPLPWEGELGAEVHRQLGAFRGPVLQLLHRDPTRRSSLRHFHETCTRLFSNRTTVEA